MVPASLKGRELETVILNAAKREESAGRLVLFRYGVQATVIGGQTVLLSSLPDFGGVLPGGRHFNIEAKCAAGASFPLASDHFRDRQYSHMVRCARMGALSFLLIHFAARQLVTKTDPGMTVAVPVDDRMSFWRRYEAGEARSLARDQALALGRIVPWTVPPRCRKPLPDIRSFLEAANAPF